MEEVDLRRCMIHKRKSHMYCETCQRIVCSKCNKCKRHTITTIDMLLDKYQDNITPVCLNVYKEEISEMLNNLRPIMEECKTKFKRSHNSFNEWEQTTTCSKEGKEKDLVLINKAIKNLREVQNEAFTNILKERSQKAIEALDIEEDILQEIGTYVNKLRILKVEMDNARNHLREYEEKRELLERLGSDDIEDNKLAFVLCQKRGIFKCKINCTISEFRGMKKIEDIFNIGSVVNKKLIDVGEGIMMSEPVIIEKPLRSRGSYFHTSLSHKGILAVYSEDKCKIIQFTNLFNGEQAVVRVEAESNVAFYDNKMILLTLWKPLRGAKVTDVFTKQEVSIFKKVGYIDKVAPWSDTSLLHSIRTLYYTSTDYIPYEYNVDTNENREMEIGHRVWVFSSLMGIDCGVKAVFQDSDDGFTYILDKNDNVVLFHDTYEEYLAALFMSPNYPKDSRKALIKYGDYFIKEEMKIGFTQPVKLEKYGSIVRIYQNFFLLLDTNIDKWVLSRIIIP